MSRSLFRSCVDKMFDVLGRDHAILADLHRIPPCVSSDIFAHLVHGFDAFAMRLYDHGLSMFMQHAKINCPTLHPLVPLLGLEQVFLGQQFFFENPAWLSHVFDGVTSLELECFLNNDQLDEHWIRMSDAFPNLTRFKFSYPLCSFVMGHGWISGRVFPRLESLTIIAFNLVLREEAKDTHRRALKIFHCLVSNTSRDVTSLLDPSTIESLRCQDTVCPSLEWWNSTIRLRELDVHELLHNVFLSLSARTTPLGLHTLKLRAPRINHCNEWAGQAELYKTALLRERETLRILHLPVTDWSVFQDLDRLEKLTLGFSRASNIAFLPSSVRILKVVHREEKSQPSWWSFLPSIQRLTVVNASYPLFLEASIFNDNEHMLSVCTMPDHGHCAGRDCGENKEWFLKHASQYFWYYQSASRTFVHSSEVARRQ